MPSAILAEDEALLRAELREALAALWPVLTIAAEAGDGAAALRAIALHRPDVVFLDVNMPQLTGLEVAKAIDGHTAIVFLTAYNQHALEAFDLGAVDYLVKPLNRGRLLSTIARLQSRGTAAPLPVPPAVWQALASAPAARKYLRWIQASVGNLLRLITTDEIIFFQADAKYTRVITAHTEALIRKPIKELMEELDPDNFMQISRGAIVNLRRVESVYKSDGYMEVRFRDHGEKLPVSPGFQPAFRQL